jgi:hypothetical protein
MLVSASGMAARSTHLSHESGAPRAPLAVTTVALALAAVYAVAIVRSGGESLLLAPLVAAVVVLAVFAHPAVGLYVLFGSAILFEQFTIAGIVPITQARFFVNINAYTPIPIRLSVADLLVLLTAASLVVQRLRARGEPLRMGTFGWAVVVYFSIFILGTVIGAARGGAWKPDVALSELRAPFHFCVMYFLAANLVRDRRQLSIFMWLFVLMVGVKALQAILSYLEALSLPYSLRSITSHEDVVFFGVAIALGVMAAVLGLRTRLAAVLLALGPVILIAELVAYRRVGFIALGVTLIAFALLTLFTHPRRGAVLVAVGSLGLAAYAVIFWESVGPVAEPLRALRTVFDASATSLVDQYSNAWRDIEHQNIAYTIQQLPLTGVGVGQRYLFEREPSNIPFPYWRFITHDALLWLWLKAGPVGAFGLWFLVARALLVGAALYRRLSEGWLRWVVALPLALVVTQIVFSSVDLGLTYSRTMIVLGASLGLTAFIAEQHPSAASGAGRRAP